MHRWESPEQPQIISQCAITVPTKSNCYQMVSDTASHPAEFLCLYDKIVPLRSYQTANSKWSLESILEVELHLGSVWTLYMEHHMKSHSVSSVIVLTFHRKYKYHPVG